MNSRKILKSLTFVVAASLVLGVAVKSAAAHIDTAGRANWLASDEQRVLRISVTPDVANNDIDLAKKSKGIDVAIIAEQNLEFGDFDVQTIEFAGAIPARSSHKSKDVDNDGMSDRIYSFTTSQLKVQPTDTIACLTAETVNKIKMRGCDKIKVIKAG